MLLAISFRVSASNCTMQNVNSTLNESDLSLLNIHKGGGGGHGGGGHGGGGKGGKGGGKGGGTGTGAGASGGHSDADMVAVDLIAIVAG